MPHNMRTSFCEDGGSAHRSLLIIMCLLIGTALSATGALAQGEGASTGDAPSASRSVSLDPEAWDALKGDVAPERVPRQLLIRDGSPDELSQDLGPAWSSQKTETGISFSLVGRPPTGREMHWSTPLEAPPAPGATHYYLRYRGTGIARSYRPLAVLSVDGTGDDGQAVSVPVLDSAEVRSDGLWHEVVGRVTLPALDHVTVRLSTIHSMASFELGEFSFRTELPSIPAQHGDAGAPPFEGVVFDTLDLTDSANDSYGAAIDRLWTRAGKVIDGGELLRSGTTMMHGVPFATDGPATPLVPPPLTPNPNNEPVEFVGIKTTRGNCMPVGRDDSALVPIERQVAEVFLLIVAEMPNQFTPFATPARPFVCNDVGQVSVELVYADGASDWAFPYSLADEGFLIQRACGVYAVAADPTRQLRHVAVHNRLYGSTFSVAAATVTTGPDRVLPLLVEDDAPAPAVLPQQPADRAPSVKRRDDVLILENSHYQVTVRLEPGLSIESMDHRRTDAGTQVGRASGLEVLFGDLLFTGRAFETESVAVDGTKATIRLHSAHPELPLDLTVDLRVDDSPSLQTRVTVETLADMTGPPTVRFPVLRDVTLGTPEDTWIFAPRYNNILSNEIGLCLSPNDFSFPTQFTDLFSPSAGAGIAIQTRNTRGAALDYGAAKAATGAAAFVEYPGEFRPHVRGSAWEGVETLLTFHGGDWHVALDDYGNWARALGTQQPVQSRDWFRDKFFIRTHQGEVHWGWELPMFDAEANQFHVDEFVAGDTEYMGLKPDMVHFFAWTDLKHGWNGHPNGDYDPAGYVGGPEILKGAVARLQEHHGIPVSLYTIPDRCFMQSQIGREFGQEMAIRDVNGNPSQYETSWLVCSGCERWREHYVEALRRTQAETGVKVIYVDVFGFPRTSKCYSHEHGHAVPGDPCVGGRMLIERLREVLPDDVVIWTEGPVRDTSIPFIDGYIHYYCMDWHTVYSPVFDRPERAPDAAPLPLNMLRYAFPQTKCVVFPCGMPNWSSASVFPFFNGEAVYDTGYMLYASRVLAHMRRAQAVQKNYSDCFRSRDPEPLVPTLRRDVYANRFPGTGRTAWTVYNGRYATVRGPVLRVPHREGATYHDAWNDETLEPVFEDGDAILSLSLDPQGIGCVVQIEAAADLE